MTRETPEYKVKRVYAKDGMVVVVSKIGDQDVERTITRSAAIQRAQEISAMVSKQVYSSDKKELLTIIERFIVAIKKASEQANKDKPVSVPVNSPLFLPRRFYNGKI